MIIEQDWHTFDEICNVPQENLEWDLLTLKPLLEIQSLTQALEAIDTNFSVNLLGIGEVEQCATTILNTPLISAPFFCRRVELHLSGTPVIYAESLCTLDSTDWKTYLNCGNLSLGKKLFAQNSSIQRSAFTYKYFAIESLPFINTEEFSRNIKTIIARKSYFTINDKKTLLIEWYLPTLIANYSI